MSSTSYFSSRFIIKFYFSKFLCNAVIYWFLYCHCLLDIAFVTFILCSLLMLFRALLKYSSFLSGFYLCVHFIITSFNFNHRLATPSVKCNRMWSEFEKQYIIRLNHSMWFPIKLLLYSTVTNFLDIFMWTSFNVFILIHWNIVLSQVYNLIFFGFQMI